MRHEEREQLEAGSVNEAGDALAQRNGIVKDLSPNSREAVDVRGGALPPSEGKLGILPPDEISAQHLVPPST